MNVSSSHISAVNHRRRDDVIVPTVGCSSTVGGGSDGILPVHFSVQGKSLSREVYGVLGIPIDCVGVTTILSSFESAIQHGRPFLISTPNLNFLTTAWVDPEFRESLLMSDLCPPDGVSVLWVARLLGLPIRKRIAGSDLFETIKDARRRDPPMKVYLFGGAEDVAALAGQKLNASKGGIVCAGSSSPPFCSVEEMSTESYIEAINTSGADFLVLALGAKKGQLWLRRNHHKVRVPVRSHLGAVINFQAGTVKRAPAVFRRCGLEWLWRIKEEPQLWKRYFDDGLSLIVLVSTHIVPTMVAHWRHRLMWRRQNLQVALHQQNEILAVTLHGDACARHVNQATGYFQRALAFEKPVVIDLKGVRFIDARFFGLLLMLRKELRERGRDVRFLRCPPKIARLFRLNGFDYLIDQPITGRTSVIEDKIGQGAISSG